MKLSTESLLCLRGSSATNTGTRERNNQKRENFFTVNE